MSRPEPSVPNMCVTLGATSRWARLLRLADSGTATSPTIAATTTSATSDRPIIAARWRRSARNVSRQKVRATRASGVADAGVDQTVEDIRQQIDDDDAG